MNKKNPCRLNMAVTPEYIVIAGNEATWKKVSRSWPAAGRSLSRLRPPRPCQCHSIVRSAAGNAPLLYRSDSVTRRRALPLSLILSNELYSRTSISAEVFAVRIFARNSRVHGLLCSTSDVPVLARHSIVRSRQSHAQYLLVSQNGNRPTLIRVI